MPPKKKAVATGGVATAADAKALLEVLEQVKGDHTRFGRYRDDPVGFARDVLGFPEFERAGRGIWRKQRDMLEAVRDHRLVTVRSGHGTGKTHSLAILTLWWLYTRGTVVTTASGWAQVRDVLWHQIHVLLGGAKVHLPRLPEHPLQTELAVTTTLRAFGRSVDNPTAFQGIHDAHLLVLIDEAPGIDPKVHRAIRSLVTGAENRLVMIGNPTEYGGPFWESHQAESRFHQIHIDCYDHPNIVAGKELIPGAVTREWVAEQREEHGEGSPEFLARVRGEFPSEGTSAVFSQKVVDRAMEAGPYEAAKDAALKDPKMPVVFALDVARYGKNKTVLAERRGGVLVAMDAWQGHDAVSTQDRVLALVGAVRDSGAQVAALVVDEVGLGGPVMDNLRQKAPWLNIVGFHSGRPAKDHIYANRRAELWLRVKRTWFDSDRARLPYHKDLRADLLAPTYGFNTSSKLQVERKEQLERRGVESPDFADAALMTWATEWGYEEPPPTPPGANQDPMALENLLPTESADSPFEALPGWA